MEKYDSLNRRVLDQYNKLTPLQKVLFVVGSIVLGVLGILFLVYNERIFKNVLLPVAQKWRDITAGWLILWALIFLVSFPPLIGYSSLLTIAGFVYGFPNGYVGSLLHCIATATNMLQLVYSRHSNDRRKHCIIPTLALSVEEHGPPAHR